MPLGLCATRKWVKGLKIFFFLHFYEIQSILSRLRHTFFFEKFREREERNARKRSERDASAKPMEAKRQSSPAGLAGRSAEGACKLVGYILNDQVEIKISN